MSAFRIVSAPYCNARGLRVGFAWEASCGALKESGYSPTRRNALLNAVAAVKRLMEEEPAGEACRSCGRDVVTACDHDVEGLIT